MSQEATSFFSKTATKTRLKGFVEASIENEKMRSRHIRSDVIPNSQII